MSDSGQRSVSLTEQRSITDADRLELADRPVELLSANSAKQINENHTVPKKSRRQTRREHITRENRFAEGNQVTTSLRTSLKVDYAIYSTHSSA